MKKVVVIGGGFAGSLIAKKLEKKFKVVLIDTKDYFEFTPGILRTIVEPEHIKKIQAMHKTYLKKTEIIIGSVDLVDKNYLKLKDGRKFEFNYLAICSGSGYSLPIKEQNILLGSRSDHLIKSNKKLKKSKTVLIVGGGLVGVELAAEICTHWEDKKVILVHSGSRLIPRNSLKTSKYAEKFLHSKGVEFLFNENIVSVKKDVCITKNGKQVKADLIFLTTGIIPNYQFMKNNFLNVLNEKNQIKVNDFLQVGEEKNIFAAGDITALAEEKTAQNAEKQAEIIVKNIFALEKKNKMVFYKSKKTPLVISLGKYDGVFESKNLVFGGKIPAFLKWAVEKKTMLRYK